ncbi:hypothetical protein B0T18DRAFT_288039, partial [Schizothecium vesticola]
CTRPQLQTLATTYLSFQTLNSTTFLPLSPTFTYTENDRAIPSPLAPSTFLSTSLTIHFTLTLYDPLLCASLIEINAASATTPYVVLARLTGTLSNTTSALELSTLDTVVSSPGDWLFNATSHLTYARSESWSPIPLSLPLRTSRVALQAAADAYLDQWGNVTLPVPLGTPCARLEGGEYTGKANATANTCAMPAFPEPLDVRNRRYVVDEEMGAVGVLNGFPLLEVTLKKGEATPSGNVFRVEGGLVRYIHEVTVCWTKGFPGCGR